MSRRAGAGRRLLALALPGLVAWACGDGAGPTQPATISVSPSIALLDSVGVTMQFSARVQDETGTHLEAPRVTWRSSDPTVASIEVTTGVTTAVGAGVVTITAASGDLTGAASLEVYLDPNTGTYTAGDTYFGRRQYIEYQAGDLPVVLAAPHGGTLESAEIPPRAFGVTTQDRNTQELVRMVSAAIAQRSGGLPHMIVCRLHRKALDANRDAEEAAQGNPFALRAWAEYHEFIEAAKQSVVAEYGRGLFVDLHGHGHEIQRVELGYLLRAADLELPDARLNQPALIERSSIRALAEFADATFVGLLRGEESLGSLLEVRGVPAVPSSTQPHPGGEPYFTGGYGTARHGSRDGGTVSGVQVEVHWSGARATEAGRQAFADALAAATDVYFATHFSIEWRGEPLEREPAARWRGLPPRRLSR